MAVMLALVMAGVTAASTAESTQQLPSPQIVQAVERELADRLADGRSTARATVVGRVADQTVPAGAVQIELGSIAGPWPRERAGVPVHVRVDGKRVGTVTVWVELHDPRQVMAYAIDYPARHAAEDVRMQPALVDMACCAGEPVADPAAIAAMRIRRSVRAGMPVMLGDFEPMPDVAHQQPVDIEVTNGPIRVMATGMALADGQMGERIPVRMTTSQAVVRGRVVAKHKVVVDE